jgi:predicted dehydrogenase
VEITATVCRPDPARPTESEGFFSARLRTEDGVVHDVGMLPTVRGSAHRPGRMACRFLIAGTEGVVYQEWCQRPEDAVAKTAASETAAGGSLGDLPLVTASLAIPDFYEGLYRAVREGAPPPVSGAEGLRAVRAWELLCQSACENRTLPISL